MKENTEIEETKKELNEIEKNTTQSEINKIISDGSKVGSKEYLRELFEIGDLENEFY